MRLTIAVAVCCGLACPPQEPVALSRASPRLPAWAGRPFLAASFRLWHPNLSPRRTR